ncbi:MAG TPA: 1-(5-phosphoribosyl)-5-[(5-phosphoribosylamino)methylideneamino]imidazole-4-carboxamide isomerase [Candidatus Anaerofilum excrementigallinarum]|nr:1-(5-phosphoribosyl)-5-[(5-phosphoribosylamino)methylideneamino]imidazole-4-carboxamide isomerase [Candidatus Anaerofilum excrementigallinarum]
MEIFPAIDLRGGQAVRLFQGNYDQMTVYSSDPLAVARGFAQAGAKNLHVVDLDGARQGEPVNLEVIGRLIRESGLQVQVGGGIRTEERIRTYLELGAARVILGTVAVENFDFTARMAAAYPGRIAVGIDMKDGMAATRGWEQVSSQSGLELCEKFLAAGVDTVICTDISRDGAQKGTNLELYRRLCALPGLRVVASGGVGSLEELAQLRQMGAWGAILGKALYTGQLELAAVMKQEEGL